MIAKKVMIAVSLSSKIIQLHDTELLSLMLASVVAFDYRTVVRCWFLMQLDEARNKTKLNALIGCQLACLRCQNNFSSQSKTTRLQRSFLVTVYKLDLIG